MLWIATLFAYASEGVAAPLVEELGSGTTAIGILLAANPLGVTIGGLRGRPARGAGPARTARRPPRDPLPGPDPRRRPRRASSLAPGVLAFGLVVGLLFVSGLGASWLIPLNVSFVQAVPQAYRGRAFGVAVSGLYGVQAIGALLAGLGAEGVSASGVLALSGGLGLLAVTPALLAYRRTQGHVAAGGAAEGPSEA